MSVKDAPQSGQSASYSLPPYLDLAVAKIGLEMALYTAQQPMSALLPKSALDAMIEDQRRLLVEAKRRAH